MSSKHTLTVPTQERRSVTPEIHSPVKPVVPHELMHPKSAKKTPRREPVELIRTARAKEYKKKKGGIDATIFLFHDSDFYLFQCGGTF